MNSSDRLDRIEAILAATAQQQQVTAQALDRLEVRTSANTAAIDRLTERIDRLTDRVERVVTAIQSHQEALRLVSQQQNEWREQMRLMHVEIRDIWQYLNNQLRNRGNGGG
ncbi:hypothetical protein QUB68_29695 [Microcoleus sp. A006_D1]|uniref:hypothetical protein n=1 Tax=Microcoleus sp. A006_D1 TaxID=3055267 RepID=UPI002FD199EC